MKKKTVLSVAASTLVTTLAVVGVTYAATPAGNDTSLLNKGTVEVDSIKVGKQGVGGVTFFNGSIVNSTTTNGVGNPITIADDARIDGRVWRGDNAGGGLGDSKPFIINDDAQVAGSLEVGGKDIFAEIGTKANASDLAAKADSSALSSVQSDVAAHDVTLGKLNGGSVKIHGSKFQSTDKSNVSFLGTPGPDGLAPAVNDVHIAPVELPDNATITGITFYGRDQSASELSVELQRIDNSGNTGSIASYTTSGNAASIRSFAAPSLSNTGVDNSSYAYFALIDVNDNANMLLSSMQIDYSL